MFDEISYGYRFFPNTDWKILYDLKIKIWKLIFYIENLCFEVYLFFIVTKKWFLFNRKS